jgi:DNA segregation ATPase FtsK/SpoIIIE, S-DNA-T family
MMIELSTSLIAGGVFGLSHYFKNSGGSNEHKKIQIIARNCGLVSRDGKEIRIHRKDMKNKKFNEYVYQIPQGMSSKQFQEKIDHFQDGLNIKKSTLDISLSDLKNLKLRKDILKQIEKLLEKKLHLRKEVEISYDGMLKIRVYNEPLTSNYTFEEAMKSNLVNWQIPIGIDRSGNLIKHCFEEIPHMAIGGATRYGKSNFINSMIVSLIKTHGENVKLYLIDLKGGIELCDYENINQTVKIAYEPEEALEVLEKAYNSMIETQKKIRKLGKKKIQDTNIKERHFVIIDEVGELNPHEAITKEEKEIKLACQSAMSKISRLGAGAGFRQILATQYGTGDIIPRQCKQNSDAKLCFRVRNATASTVVLDEGGAEKLPLIKGRAIYQTDQRFIVQTPRINDDQINEVIKVNFKARKETPKNEQRDIKAATPRGNMLIVEETRLS